MTKPKAGAERRYAKGLGFGIPLDVAQRLGAIEQRKNSFRVVIYHAGRRYQIGQAPIAGTWTVLRTRAAAELVLAAIRAEAASTTVERALAPYLRRPVLR